MKTPPFLLGAALLFWGWQTGHPLWGCLAAAGLEGARLLRWQWALGEEDYNRLADLSDGLAVTLGLYFLLSEKIGESAFHFFQWLPMVALPIMAAQYCGPRQQVPYRCFFWVFRRRIRLDPPDRGMNIAYPYFATCLLATSAVKPENLQFYAGFCGLVAWSLWFIRPRRSSPLTWLLLLAGVTAAGYEGQRRLHQLQGLVDGQLVNWMAWGRKELDVAESRTAIGRIGRLKLSNRIVWRLATDGRHPPPALLRQASYVQLRQNTWHGETRDFVPIPAGTNDSWALLPDKTNLAGATIAGFLKHGEGVLPLPHGTAQIGNLPSGGLEHNRLGVVRVVQGPGFVNFQSGYGSGDSMDGKPDPQDLSMPGPEAKVFEQIAQELELAKQTPAEALRRVAGFFANRFSYTTYQSAEVRDPTGQQTPLGWFMLKHRAGHCEYFASATVLLLRAAHLPARYATGYSVQEKGRGSNYVLRERHAHAWCLVYRPDLRVWEDFDTTPASWSAIEAQNASLFQQVFDFTSWLWFEFTKWRYGKAGLRRYLVGLMAPVLLVLAWRVLANKQRARRQAHVNSPPAVPAWPGQDSDFHEIERRLMLAGWRRESGETLTRWLRRLDGLPGISWGGLEAIVALHYRYRFDPAGLEPAAKAELKTLVQSWLEQYEAAPGSPPGASGLDRAGPAAQFQGHRS